jgi:hypothetical protein
MCVFVMRHKRLAFVFTSSIMDDMYRNEALLRRLRMMATHPYTVRHAQILLELEGYKRPSLDFIWKFFNKHRRKVKRIM